MKTIWFMDDWNIYQAVEFNLDSEDEELLLEVIDCEGGIMKYVIYQSDDYRKILEKKQKVLNHIAECIKEDKIIELTTLQAL